MILEAYACVLTVLFMLIACRCFLTGENRMINIGRFNKSLAVVLAALLVLTMLPEGLLKAEAAEQKTTLSIVDGSIVIGDGTVTQNGVSLVYNSNGYLVTGSGTTSNTIAVTGGTQNITLAGVNIDVSSASGCAFSIASGASVSLTLSGANTLKSGVNCAGLQVPEGASVAIAGTDADGLTAIGGSGGAGIGSDMGIGGNGGAVTITGGTVTATGGSTGAGIGGGGANGYMYQSGSGGTVTITGGTVTATGGSAGAGIGGGGDDSYMYIGGSGGTVTITGGTVTATGGSTGAGIGGGGDMFCGGSGGMVTITGGTVTATGNNNGEGIGQGSSEYSDIGSSGNTVITGGSVKASSASTVTDAGGSTEHCVTVTGLTAGIAVNCSVNGGKTFFCETDSDGKLYLWMPAGDDKIAIGCGNIYRWANVTVSNSDTSTTAGAATAVLDIGTGSVTISDGSISQLNNPNCYCVNDCVITQSSGVSTANTVSVTGGKHNIVLENTDIENDSGCAFSIAPGASVSLTFSGENLLRSGGGCAGLQVPEGASVTITGTDADQLTAAGGSGGAGIGGGSGMATGGIGGSGIGGGSGMATGGNGGAITITGGMVTATGGSGGAGIGGGSNMADGGNGGAVTITGGTVTATAGNTGESGSTVITGGMVKASSVPGTVTDAGGNAEHCVTVSGLTAGINTKCSVNGGATISCETDSAGKLYFWMTAGKNTATICCEGTYYGADVTVTDTDISTTAGALTVFDIGTGSVTLSDGSISQQNNPNSYSVNDCVITQSSGDSTANTVSVNGGKHNIVLENVDIENSSGCAFTIASGAVASLVLSGKNTFKSGGGGAGLGVPSGAKVVITGTDESSLTASGDGAGIGGGDGQSGGTVVISGGTVNAFGGAGSAGIGGGCNVGNNNGGSGGSVTITGGTVTATGGVYDNYMGGAGIGGGCFNSSRDFLHAGNGGSVTVSGGTVYATGKNGGAGIGGGGTSRFNNYGGNGASVIITGGTVYASSEVSGAATGAGIGGGGGTFGGAGGSLTISGGTVYASAEQGINYRGAGIGGGGSNQYGAAGGSVNISGGTVYVTGGTGIGGSYGWGDGGNYGGSSVTITGGSVNANIQNTPTSDGTTKVYPATVTLPYGKEIDSLSVTQESTVSYGFNDMHTDGNEALYLYLPASAADDDTTVDVTADEAVYSGYHGTIETSGTNILKMDQSLAIDGVVPSYTYGQTFTPAVMGGAAYITASVTYSGTDAVTGSAVTDSPAQPTDAGSYTVTAAKAGSSIYNAGTASVNFTIIRKSIASPDISVLDITAQVYQNGSAVTPEVTVKDEDAALTEGEDYSVAYQNNTDEGTATAAITGIGNYQGSIGKNFIIDKEPTIDVECASGSSLSGWSSSVTLAIGYTVGSSGLQSIMVSRDGNLGQTAIEPRSDGTYQYTLTQGGTYTFTVTGNSAFTASQTITAEKIDSGAPSLGSVTGNPTEPVQSALLSVTAAPGVSGIGSTKISRRSDSGQWVQIQDAQINDTANADGSHTYSYTTAQNGTYQFTVTSAAGVSADSGSVDVTKIDTAKPVVQIDSNSYSEGDWTNQNVTLDVSDGTANLGTTTYEYSTDGATWTAFGGSLTDSDEGMKTYRFRATSESGLMSDVQSISVKLDKTAPETRRITIANNSFTTFLNTITFGMFFQNTQTATVTAADSASGIATIRYQLVHTQSEYIESGTWAAYPSGGISLSPDNRYIVYAEITDHAGNGVIISSDGVVADQTGPDLQLSVPSGWQTSDAVSADVTVSDALAGLQSVSYTTDEATPQSGMVNLTNGSGSITLTREGQYNLTVTATDKAGNSVSRTSLVQWDKTQPTINVSGNPANPAQSAVLHIEAATGTSGLNSVTVSGPQGAKNITDTYHSGYTAVQNGTYTFTVMNNAGVSVSSPPVVVENIDAAQPVVQIDSNGYSEGDWINQNVTLDVSDGTANLGTTTYEYSTDGGATWVVFGGSLTDSEEGIKTYWFRVASESGLVSDVQSVTVKLDKTAPVNMAVVFQQNPFKTVSHFVTFGLFFGNTVDVCFSADDFSGVDHYEYQAVAEDGTFDPYGTWQTGSLSIAPDFKGAVYARAVDQAGNISGTVTKSLVIDKNIPIITAQSTLVTADPNSSIPVTVEDGGAGIGAVVYQVNGGAAETVDLTADGYTDLTDAYTFSVGNLPDGVYDVTVNAQDNSGNSAVTATVHVVKNAAQTGFGFDSAELGKTYGDAPFTVAATGGQGDGAVTYAVTSGADILEVGAATGKVSIQKAGTAVITATKAGSNGYRQATAELTVNVSKAAPKIQELPTASDIVVVGKLSSAVLTGGKSSVAGSFGWTSPNAVVSKSGEYEVTFTPSDSEDYFTCTDKVMINVMPVITNSGTGVQYDLTDTNLPEGVTSVSVQSSAISEEDSGSSAYAVVRQLIGGSTSSSTPSAEKLFNLSLSDQNNQAVTGFTGKITVRIPIPDGMSGDLRVYWYSDADYKVTDMNAKQENGYLVFETTHFSYYVVAEQTAESSPDTGAIPNPVTGSDPFPFCPAMLCVISACGLVIMTKGRKFRKKTS